MLLRGRSHEIKPRCQMGAPNEIVPSDRQWEGAARTSILAFQRPSPRVRNPHACNIDLPLARIRGLAIGGHKPGANQIGQHINADPMREQRCPAAVLQTCDGKQFECAALVRVDFRSVQHLLEL